MRHSVRALAGIVILGLCGGVYAGSGGSHRLVVRLFKIPGDQSFESTLPDGRGGNVTVHARSGVNAAFPHATVFFPTELAANASTGAITDAIMQRVFFGSGGLVAKDVRVDEIKMFNLELSQDRPRAEAQCEESRGEGRTSTYRVAADFVSAEQGRILVRLRLDTGWSAHGGHLGTSLSGDIFSAPFEIPESMVFLIGGPSWDKPSGTVYWLAVSVLPD